MAAMSKQEISNINDCTINQSAGDITGISEETAAKLSKQFIDALKDREESFKEFSKLANSCLISTVEESFIRESSRYTTVVGKLVKASFLTRWFYKRKADKLWKKVSGLSELLKELKDGKTQFNKEV